MPVTIIPIVTGAFETVIKGLLKGLEDLEVGGRVETIQTTDIGTDNYLSQQKKKKEKSQTFNNEKYIISFFIIHFCFRVLLVFNFNYPGYLFGLVFTLLLIKQSAF